jgi:integrase
MTFKECADAYIEAHSAGWRDLKTLMQWTASLTTYVYPLIGQLPVQAIDVALVMKAVEPLWATKTETASRVRGRIESVLDWATARGYRQGDNPARWRGHLENLLPKRNKVQAVEHHAALPYQEIGAFMVELRAQTSVASKALEFAILTAARRAEVLGARWPEVNLTERVWIVPAARMKAGKEHRVPLSAAAVAVLEGLPRLSDYVFPGQGEGKPLGEVTMWRVLRALGRGDLTAHGFRATFSTWAAERTAFPSEVAEMALAHTVGDAVVRAYQRGDMFEKRRQIMDSWAKFCDQPATGGEVVALRG